jgi:hypothetical protein
VERETIDWKTRVAPRRGVSHTASLEVADGRRFRVLVTNLSYTGCQLLSEQRLEIGQTVGLSLPGRGSMDAQVRWTAGDCYGLQFLLGQSTVEDRRARIGV